MTISAPMISRNMLKKSILQDSFFEFVRCMWDVVIPEEPIYNWHIEYICEELQKLAVRVFNWQQKENDLVINIPPGSTKSTICSVMFPPWTWTNMPSARHICSSYSYTLSLELSRKSRMIFKSDKYQELFPMEMAPDQDAKGYFVNEHEGGRWATSTGGTVMGSHAHFLDIDDPLNPLQAASEVELKKANTFIGETLASRKVDKKITPTILVMQRLHEDDPTSNMIEVGKKAGIEVRHINLPAEINEKTGKTVRPRSLRRKYVDDPDQPGSKLLDPIRMDRPVLTEFQAKLGSYGYAGQFEQSPTPLEGGMFKIERFKYRPKPKSLAGFVQVCRGWDKAATEGGGCYSVGALIGEDKNGQFWVLDVIRFQLDSGEREKLIKDTATIDGRDILIGLEQEGGSGGKESAQNSVKMLAGYNVFSKSPTGDKAARALPFATQVNVENVIMVEGEWNRDYINELKFFPFSKYKDQVDATSVAFTVLTTGLNAGVW